MDRDVAGQSVTATRPPDPARVGMEAPRSGDGGQVLKRAFDVLLSLGALAVLALPLLITTLVLRFTGEGEVLFFQERIGYLARRFKVWKFATMRRDSETTGTKDITVRDDPRVLPVGRVLRKTKLNELPQLVNVLKGDMSFIGWRPLTDRTFGWYPPDVKEQIVKTKPGLTGIGSIVFRDEESLIERFADGRPEDFYRDHIAPYKGALELWYQRHQSFWLDLKLILLTAQVVLAPNKRVDETVLPDLPPRPAALSGKPD